MEITLNKLLVFYKLKVFMNSDILSFFVSVWLKFFFLLTPFFTLSMFLVLTRSKTVNERRLISVRTSLAVIVICLFIYFFGNAVFKIFGITIDAFRIGAGIILMLSAVSLVGGSDKGSEEGENGDISVVPLAIPMTIGPGTIGALLVMGADIHTASQQIAGCFALAAAGLSLGIMLYCSAAMEKILGARGLKILSKITGLILSALAAQIIFTGIMNFFKGGAQ